MDIRRYPYASATIDTSYFCEDIIPAGTIVFEDEPDSMGNIIATQKNTGKLLGICMNDVVEFDGYSYARPSEVMAGAKIGILSRGIIHIRLPKRLGILPIGQPIYVGKNGNPTLKITNNLLGYVYKSRDKDGYHQLELRRY